MTRALLAALAVALIALAAVGVIAKRQATEIGQIRGENATLTQALKRAEQQRKDDAATLALRAKENAATARKTAALEQSLAAAVRQERVWADEAVPEAVRKALEQTP